MLGVINTPIMNIPKNTKRLFFSNIILGLGVNLYQYLLTEGDYYNLNQLCRLTSDYDQAHILQTRNQPRFLKCQYFSNNCMFDHKTLVF